MRYVEVIRADGLPTNIMVDTICCWNPHITKDGKHKNQTEVTFNGCPVGLVIAMPFDQFTKLIWDTTT
jgi:hypothetical protein